MHVIKGALKSGVSKFRSFQPKKTEGLDLSYIPYGQGQQRIIAMCLPSGGGGMDFLLRNDAAEVGQYLDQRHPRSYKVYNLTEHAHPDHVREIFHGATVHIPIPDHNVPRFDQMVNFCEDAFAFLEASPSHIVAVHCKAGKGRTGVMIVSLLLYSGACKTIQEALDVFSRARSELTTVVKADEKGGKDEINRGVDQASQLRWLEYWQRFIYETLRDGLKNQEQLTKINASLKVLTGVVVWDMNTPNVDRSSYPPPYIIVREWGYKGTGGTQLCRRACKKEKRVQGGRRLTYEFPDLLCQGEIKLEFWDIGVIKDGISYRCWFHPYFVGSSNRLVLQKTQIDDVWNSSKYGSKFCIQLNFADPTDIDPKLKPVEAQDITSQSEPEHSRELSVSETSETRPAEMDPGETTTGERPSSERGPRKGSDTADPSQGEGESEEKDAKANPLSIDESYFYAPARKRSLSPSRPPKKAPIDKQSFLSEKELLRALQKAISVEDSASIWRLAEQNRHNPELPASVVSLLEAAAPPASAEA